MERSMRIVVIEPDKPPYVTNICTSLVSMQKAVGGYIEIVPAEWIHGGDVLRDRNLLLVVNEEGKNENLKPNFPLKDESDYICGTAFVCKGKGEEIVGLSEKEAKLVIGLIRRGEKAKWLSFQEIKMVSHG